MKTNELHVNDTTLKAKRYASMCWWDKNAMPQCADETKTLCLNVLKTYRLFLLHCNGALGLLYIDTYTYIDTYIGLLHTDIQKSRTISTSPTISITRHLYWCFELVINTSITAVLHYISITTERTTTVVLRFNRI